MSERTYVHDGALPLSAERRVNEACNRFELAWQAGRRPRIEDYLGEAPAPERPALLGELIALEIDLRQRAREAPSADEYRARFPADTLGSSLDALLADAFTPDSSLPSAQPTALGSLHEPSGEDTADPARPHAPERPPSGRAGRNLLYGEIGHGGMGTVFKGRDPDLGRELAVKMLHENHRDDPELVRRFLEEAQISGQLQHPGVVPVYELGRAADDRPFFTMKLVKGRTLADLLKQRANPRDGLPRFLTVFEQVCQTLAYAHARGVVHRDLKPANVMVGNFGEVQVVDWGMAKVLRGGTDGAPGREHQDHGEESTVICTARSGSTGEASRPGTILGTLSFMPPEQAGGEVDRIDERADVFGLGAILCTILTGQPPYTGRDASELQRKALRGDLADALARLDACGADAELTRLCKDCLAAERDDRPREGPRSASGGN
jgi:hypothetical protein